MSTTSPPTDQAHEEGIERPGTQPTPPVQRRRWRRGFVESRARRSRLDRFRNTKRDPAWFERRWSSRMLHRLGEITSHAGAGLVVAGSVLAWLVVGAFVGFPSWWEVTLYAASSSVTLIMVFAIQHTQARQQSAIQRKLDEVLRATATASDQLIAVEEAPDEELELLADRSIDDRQRSSG